MSLLEIDVPWHLLRDRAGLSDTGVWAWGRVQALPGTSRESPHISSEMAVLKEELPVTSYLGPHPQLPRQSPQGVQESAVCQLTNKSHVPTRKQRSWQAA